MSQHNDVAAAFPYGDGIRQFNAIEDDMLSKGITRGKLSYRLATLNQARFIHTGLFTIAVIDYAGRNYFGVSKRNLRDAQDDTVGDLLALKRALTVCSCALLSDDELFVPASDAPAGCGYHNCDCNDPEGYPGATDNLTEGDEKAMAAGFGALADLLEAVLGSKQNRRQV